MKTFEQYMEGEYHGERNSPIFSNDAAKRAYEDHKDDPAAMASALTTMVKNSKALDKNKAKAMAMIQKNRASADKLLQGVYNFLLAYDNPDNKVVEV